MAEASADSIPLEKKKPVLQSDLLRVVTYTLSDDGRANIERLFGTAFLVGKDGAFLTAAHVVKSAFDLKADGQHVAVVGSHPDLGVKVAPILQCEFAPENRDVAIGISKYKHPTEYEPCGEKCEVWSRVATCGYPEDAIYTDKEDKLGIPLRAYKGIIQRVVEHGAIAHLPDSEGYELSFIPSPGVSGAPLFLYPGQQIKVVAICVGAFRSERIEDEIVEIDENGNKYKETRIQVVQFGFAESLAPLIDWTPSILGGKRLGELAQESKNAQAKT